MNERQGEAYYQKLYHFHYQHVAKNVLKKGVFDLLRSVA